MEETKKPAKIGKVVLTKQARNKLAKLNADYLKSLGVPPTIDVGRESERLNKEDVKGEREIAKRAGEKGKRSWPKPPDWLKPPTDTKPRKPR